VQATLQAWEDKDNRRESAVKPYRVYLLPAGLPESLMQEAHRDDKRLHIEIEEDWSLVLRTTGVPCAARWPGIDSKGIRHRRWRCHGSHLLYLRWANVRLMACPVQCRTIKARSFCGRWWPFRAQGAYGGPFCRVGDALDSLPRQVGRWVMHWTRSDPLPWRTSRAAT
jgi:hypothetical protein